MIVINENFEVFLQIVTTHARKQEKYQVTNECLIEIQLKIVNLHFDWFVNLIIWKYKVKRFFQDEHNGCNIHSELECVAKFLHIFPVRVHKIEFNGCVPTSFNHYIICPEISVNNGSIWRIWCTSGISVKLIANFQLVSNFNAHFRIQIINKCQLIADALQWNEYIFVSSIAKLSCTNSNNQFTSTIVLSLSSVLKLTVSKYGLTRASNNVGCVRLIAIQSAWNCANVCELWNEMKLIDNNVQVHIHNHNFVVKQSNYIQNC